ncbi:MAG: GTPase Era [Candidatus Acidiferrales bacterium]|jgi:GTP-binding protein Era
MAEFRAGFVAVVGRPNSGKSTLVNRLVGQKISIVTARPQTTRNRIQGIVNRPEAQVVLIDTPGLHRPDSVLGKQMSAEVDAALEGVDVVALLLDASERLGQSELRAIARAQAFRGPRLLLLNKIDRVEKSTLLPLIERCQREGKFDEIIPISALKGSGVEDALAAMIARLPVGPPLFPPDQITDQPERFLAGEIVREKAMAATREEVPHAVAVIVESFEEGAKLVRISATIHVEREGQKGILIGAGGATLKKIGTEARRELEVLLGTKVFLELRVKVSKDWRDNAALVRQMDWRRQLEMLSGE